MVGVVPPWLLTQCSRDGCGVVGTLGSILNPGWRCDKVVDPHRYMCRKGHVRSDGNVAIATVIRRPTMGPSFVHLLLTNSELC